MGYDDATHRPHADHRGESPQYNITVGPESIQVILDDWGPRHAFAHIVRYTQSNWGEHPLTLQEVSQSDAYHPNLEATFGGKTLQQVLEGLTFWFTVDGISRACTHQMVRTRFAAFMQHGGRDNDWRHRDWTMPETIARMVEAEAMLGDNPPYGLRPPPVLPDGRALCVQDWEPIDRLIGLHDTASSLIEVIESVLHDCHLLYAKLVDAGVPWQDARRVLPMGTQTYLHAIYNYVSLRDVLANRLEHIMDWEINCVAQLMLREVKLNCPTVVWQHLGSHSDRLKKAAFAGLESWPPDGKYPVPEEFQDRPRAHRPEQNPFWVLHPSSWDGGPVKWVATNGTYPASLSKDTPAR